jgi:hypothetical protein
MEFVAPVGHLDPVDHLAVGVRLGVDIDDGQEVRRVDVLSGVQPHHVGGLLAVGLLDGRLRGRVARPLDIVSVVVMLVWFGVCGVFCVAHACMPTSAAVLCGRIPAGYAATYDMFGIDGRRS